MRLMNKTNTETENLSLDSEKLATLIKLVVGGKINRKAYKEVVEKVFVDDIDPEKYISQKGLMMIQDDDAVLKAVESVLSSNEKSIADYRSGKEKAFGFLMGQVMKQLQGKGNPASVKKILTEKLSN